MSLICVGRYVPHTNSHQKNHHSLLVESPRREQPNLTANFWSPFNLATFHFKSNKVIVGAHNMPKPQQKKSILSKESRQSPSTNKSPVDEGRASLCQLTQRVGWGKEISFVEKLDRNLDLSPSLDLQIGRAHWALGPRQARAHIRLKGCWAPALFVSY